MRRDFASVGARGLVRSSRDAMLRKSPASAGFTLIELIVVIAIIAVLAALAFPVFSSVQERARVTQDMNNLRQIGLGMQTYLNDNDGIIPATATWPGITTAPVLYPKYLGSRRVFQSPFDKRTPLESDTAPVSYSINTNMYVKVSRNMQSVVSPSSTIFLAPMYGGDPRVGNSWAGTMTSAPDLAVGGSGSRGTHANGNQINALFCDLHSAALKFGPSSIAGTFQDTTSNPLGQKTWDPTK
jgi:prepilin-type N-terminal cleavage/methylation domain-containing protein